MRIVHFNSTDLPGAGSAAVRLHAALLRSGEESRLVLWKQTYAQDGVEPLYSKDIRTRLRYEINLGAAFLFRRLYHPSVAFTFDLLGSPFSHLRSFERSAEVVNLHWVAGLIHPWQLGRLGRYSEKPLVWTLMDHAPFTGGCHYVASCRRYRDACGHCPAIGSRMSRDLTFWSLRQKKAALSRRRVVVVAGSKQDAALARQSSLFAKTRVTVIPVPVDERVFRPTPRELARQVLDLALERKTVFAAARRMSDARKGFQVLLEGLHRLRADDPFLAAQMTILTAGDDPPPELFRLPYEVRHLGVLRDDRSLALAYQAADVYVSPSLEDSGPMMVLESLCCGTPIVAFPVGYAADLLAEHRVGAVAPLGDAVGLVAAIRRVLALAPQEKAELDLACRRAALVYCASSFVAAKYREIYRELAEQKGVAL